MIPTATSSTYCRDMGKARGHTARPMRSDWLSVHFMTYTSVANSGDCEASTRAPTNLHEDQRANGHPVRRTLKTRYAFVRRTTAWLDPANWHIKFSPSPNNAGCSRNIRTTDSICNATLHWSRQPRPHSSVDQPPSLCSYPFIHSPHSTNSPPDRHESAM